MSLQEKEAYDLAKCKLAEYLQDSAVCSMDEYVQHGTTSTLQHCLSVVHISCAMAEKLHIRVNYENLIVGALLHDFYLYDWHTHQDEGVLHGFAHPDALLTGVETRSSSPVRLPRNRETLMAERVDGLYPAGEGAGFAGGIVSAAVDGMQTAIAALHHHAE